MVLRRSGLARASTYGRVTAFPFSMRSGKKYAAMNVTPSRAVVPKVPHVIRNAPNPTQFPCVGRALTLHGHPQSQLHTVM